MNSFATLPILFLKFYFWEGPRGIIDYFKSLNGALLQFLSLGLIVKTFFKPWKSEYREGFVGIAIGIGMVIKTFAILAESVFFIFLLAVEAGLVIGFVLWPVVTILLLLPVRL